MQSKVYHIAFSPLGVFIVGFSGQTLAFAALIGMVIWKLILGM